MDSRNVWSQNVTDIVYVAEHLGMTLCTFLAVRIPVFVGTCCVYILGAAVAILILIPILLIRGFSLLIISAQRITSYYHGRDIGRS